MRRSFEYAGEFLLLITKEDIIWRIWKRTETGFETVLAFLAIGRFLDLTVTL